MQHRKERHQRAPSPQKLPSFAADDDDVVKNMSSCPRPSFGQTVSGHPTLIELITMEGGTVQAGTKKSRRGAVRTPRVPVPACKTRGETLIYCGGCAKCPMVFFQNKLWL